MIHKNELTYEAYKENIKQQMEYEYKLIDKLKEDCTVKNKYEIEKRILKRIELIEQELKEEIEESSAIDSNSVQ